MNRRYGSLGRERGESHKFADCDSALATVIGDEQVLLRGARYSRAREIPATESLFRLGIIITPRGPRSQYGAAADPRNESMIDDPTDAHH